MSKTEALRVEEAVAFLEQNRIPGKDVGTVHQGIELILNPREDNSETQPQKGKIIDLFVSKVRKLRSA